MSQHSEKNAEWAEKLLEAAKRAGASDADVLVVSDTELSVSVRQGQLEQAERAENEKIGLRVFCGQRQACVATSTMDEETVSLLAARAVAMAEQSPDDPYIGLAAPEQLAKDWDINALELRDPSPEPTPETLEAQAHALESAMMAVKGVTQAESSGAAYGLRHYFTAASNGFRAGFSQTSSSLSCGAIAGEGQGMERDFDGDRRMHAQDLRSPQEIGTCAANRAVERLNPKPAKTGRYPVLFDERVSSSLIGHLRGAINGEAISRGASWLRDALGEAVLPASMSLVEDPHRPRAFGSRLFDAEGLATQKRSIVDNGVLTGWILDLRNARKLGMSSTANAVRGLSAPPMPSSWNLALSQGTQSVADLLQEMGNGLYVTSMIGSTINPNTGDYSRGASGFWVENGQIAFPVNEATIAGNLREMLMNMIPANDARSYQSTVVPSLLVEGLTIASA